MDKKYDYSQVEAELQAKWQREQTYALANNPGSLFSIDTPPPTVSGALHIGHIFSYTQTDIIARYKRMQGFSVFYPFGFDDNGLPTERYVEKKLGIRAQDVARSEFIKFCLAETAAVETQFKILWQQIGLSVNWEYCYSTISERSRRISQESFIRLLQTGFVYRRPEPALYCTTCQTAVAQAELEDRELSSLANTIVFSGPHNSQLPICTTRPELLFSCVAVLYHPEDTRYQHLKGSLVTVPIFGHQVPVLTDELVKPDKGTGLVMCCTFGDQNDIAWHKKFQLPYRQSIGLDGRWVPATGPLAGLKAAAARNQILKLLQSADKLLAQKTLTHAVNTHERCKKEIEYIVIPQWFIKILDYKKEFLNRAAQINWHPQFMQTRYKDWVENLNWDWCISRQRFFGIPFPVWHCQDCQQILLPKLAALPVDPQEQAYPDQSCSNCHGHNIVPDTDVMDTWNTSSLTPQLCFDLWRQQPMTSSVFTNPELTKFLPMSMRPQAHDIIRTWAFDTIVKSELHFQCVPWLDIVISGHVLSSEKEKLSKSHENCKVSPTLLLQQYSADAIRYWTAAGNLGTDVAFSENQLKIGSKLIVKLWNAFLFCHEHLLKLNQTNTESYPPHTLAPVHQWLLHRSTETYHSYQNYLNQFEFGLALQVVERFFWSDFCDNYLELIKHQLFQPHKITAAELQATLTTLHQVGLRILQLYAPYLPYVTEKIFQSIYSAHLQIPSLHQTKFSPVQTNHNFPASAGLVKQILDLVSQIRKLKTVHQLSLKTEITELKICCQPQLSTKLQANESWLKGVTQAQTITYVDSELNGSELNQIDDRWYAQIKLS